VLFDAARSGEGDAATLLHDVAGVVESSRRTAIVRHVGCLSPAALQALSSLAEAAERHGSRVIATSTLVPGDDPPDPGASLGLRLEVPPLRDRIDDVLDLIPHLIGRRGSSAHLSSAAIQTLMRLDWPGNVRELDSLLRALILRGRPKIGRPDLPPAYRGSGRPLRRIEQIEQSAILRALAEADGNKTHAAASLEISRATLYRKLRAYGMDLDLTTG
jgi:hypothetical protein